MGLARLKTRKLNSKNAQSFKDWAFFILTNLKSWYNSPLDVMISIKEVYL